MAVRRRGSGRGATVVLPTVVEVGLELLHFCLECADVVFKRFEVLLRTGLFCSLLAPCALLGVNGNIKNAHICQ